MTVQIEHLIHELSHSLAYLRQGGQYTILQTGEGKNIASCKLPTKCDDSHLVSIAGHLGQVTFNLLKNSGDAVQSLQLNEIVDMAKYMTFGTSDYEPGNFELTERRVQVLVEIVEFATAAALGQHDTKLAEMLAALVDGKSLIIPASVFAPAVHNYARKRQAQAVKQ